MATNTMMVQNSNIWVLSVAAVFVAVWAMTITETSAIACYSCHLEPGSNHCLDAGSLLGARMKYYDVFIASNSTQDEETDTMQELNDYLTDKCDASMPFCVVEHIIVNSQYKLMYRDCSDGRRFSAPINGTRLEENKPHADNITHCTYQENIGGQICISLCDEDFCNGPSYSAGVGLSSLGSGWLHVLAVALSVLAMF